jgi:hypothetical protein
MKGEIEAGKTNNMEQKTAVEWLIHELNTRQKPLYNNQIDELFEQSREMEKQQLMNAFLEGKINYNKEWAIEYYNKTYGK